MSRCPAAGYRRSGSARGSSSSPCPTAAGSPCMRVRAASRRRVPSAGSASPTSGTGGCRGARSSRRPPPLPAKGSRSGRRLRATSRSPATRCSPGIPRRRRSCCTLGASRRWPARRSSTRTSRPPSTGSATPAPATCSPATWPLPSPRTRRTAAASSPGPTSPHTGPSSATRSGSAPGAGTSPPTRHRRSAAPSSRSCSASWSAVAAWSSPTSSTSSSASSATGFAFTTSPVTSRRTATTSSPSSSGTGSWGCPRRVRRPTCRSSTRPGRPVPSRRPRGTARGRRCRVPG